MPSTQTLQHSTASSSRDASSTDKGHDAWKIFTRGKRSKKIKAPLSAMQRVIGTTELLEAILAQLVEKDYGLGARTLLRSRRVSRTFKDLIDRSSDLQRGLFSRQGPKRGTSLEPKFWNTFILPRLQIQICSKPRVWLSIKYDRSSTVAFTLIGDRIDAASLNTGSWRNMYILPSAQIVHKIECSGSKITCWRGKISGATVGQLLGLALGLITADSLAPDENLGEGTATERMQRLSVVDNTAQQRAT